MIRQRLDDNWQMRPAGEERLRPAAVPGSVYGDLLNNGEMEDPFWKDNEDRALALMDKDYEYVDHFDCGQELLSCDEVYLHFYGLDTLADISLNGHFLGHAENMHREWEYPVKSLLRAEGNELGIHFYSPTKFIAEAFEKAPTLGSEDAMRGFVHLRKAHCMFGWDWGAHLPDAGIFRPVELQGVTAGRFRSVYFHQEHLENLVKLDFDVDFEWLKEDLSAKYRVEITDPDGTVTVFSGSPSSVEIPSPRLWWPNGYGEQALYKVRFIMESAEEEIDVFERRIGLRTLTMTREKDQWGESFAATVNGVQIFAMGGDYIPEDHLLGRVTPQTTRALLEKARFANFNSIRVWGGGYYPDDWFYDICDELGLLVWQDFMFACAVYDLTPAFEANIRAEFKDNIIRLRNHPSLCLWCGNNEMEMFVAQKNWVSKPSETRDYILMYERIIPEMLAKYDPDTFYWPASPSSGGTFDYPNDPNRGDVHYWEVWHQNRPFSDYRKYYFRYASEFGFQSFPSEATIDTFTDDPRDKNIFSYIMEKHQRNGSANGKIMNYMQQTYLYPTDFNTVIYASQLLQADAIRYGVEHFRRNRGRCMGAIYWQLNDCWPVASWSSVDYTGRLKALHYAARRFFAPVMISCQEEGMMSAGQNLNWLPFEFEKSIRLNVANETREDVRGTVRFEVRNADASVERQEETHVTVPALTSLWLNKVLLPDIDIYNQYVSYSFENEEGETVSGGTVLFSSPKYFRFLDPALTFTLEGDEILVKSGTYARSVEIRNENDDLILTDNFFDLNGDEKRVRILSGEPKGLVLRSVYDIH